MVSLIRITGLRGAFVPLLSNDLSWRILWGRCLFHFFRILITSLLSEKFGKARQMIAGLLRTVYCIVPPVVLMVLVTMPFTAVRQTLLLELVAQMAGVLGFMTNYEERSREVMNPGFIPRLFVLTGV